MYISCFGLIPDGCIVAKMNKLYQATLLVFLLILTKRKNTEYRVLYNNPVTPFTKLSSEVCLYFEFSVFMFSILEQQQVFLLPLLFQFFPFKMYPEIKKKNQNTHTENFILAD